MFPVRDTQSWNTSAPTPKAKETHTEAFVAFFQYSPYRKGARKAPASAPQETPIICAMKVMPGFASLMMAMAAETAMKKTIKPCIIPTTVFSSGSFFILGMITSRVSVELEVSTSEDRVDMEAESTSTITIAMMTSGSVDSMVGMMVSNAGFPEGV